MKLRLTHILSVAGLALAPLAPAGCATPTSCSIADGADGTATLSCTDGSSYVIRQGADGAKGVDGIDGVAVRLGRGEHRLHAWVFKIETGQVFAFQPAEGQFLPLTIGTNVNLPLGTRI